MTLSRMMSEAIAITIGLRMRFLRASSKTFVPRMKKTSVRKSQSAGFPVRP